MTFREHLDELRHSLVRAVLWLAAGLVIGLLFADRVVLFVQSPLQTAIREYMADRDLFRLGYDPMDPANAPLKEFLATNALVWEIIYDVPDEYQTLTMDSLVLSSNVNDPASAAGPVEATVKSGVDSNLSEANSKEKSQPKVETDSASEDRNPEADSILEKLNFTQGSIKPVEMAKLLQSLPDPSVLKPKVQLRQNKTGLSSLKMEEPFMIWVKAGLIVGAVLASPMIFYHLWSFIASGLHAHERRYVYIYLPLSVLLFSSGVVLAFFVVLNYVLTFLLAFNGSLDVAIEPRLTYYVNFVLLLPLGFGIAFQLPLVMLFLQRIGLFETEAYVSSWRLAVLVIFLVSMILTPADVTSMFAMAVPLVFLYGLGILMCKFIPRGRGLGTAAYDPA